MVHKKLTGFLLGVLVVSRDAFKEIISADPALLGPISEIAARRQAAQEEHRHAYEQMPTETEGQRAQRLTERIRAFFHL